MEDVLMRNLAHTVAFAAECLLTIWFFRPLENRTEGRWRWLGYAVLAGYAWLFFTPTLGSSGAALVYLQSFWVQCVRVFLHWTISTVYLWFVKELSARRVVYFSTFFTILTVAAQNMKTVAWLLNSTGTVYRFVTAFAPIVMAALAVYFVHKNIALEKIRTIDNVRFAIVGIVGGLELYFKWSLMVLQDILPNSAHIRNMAVLALFATLGVFACMLLVEVNSQTQAEKSRAQEEQTSLAYEMQNAKRALQTNNDIRRLYHDMKNHLLAIQDMAGEKEELNEYLQQLLPQIEGYETRVSTGNPTVDALLSEKIQRAKLDEIQFNVVLDLKKLEHLRSVDLVTIFGNAVDNAIEAVQMLPAGQERIVYIKSSRFANMEVLRFSNQFVGTIPQKNGTLLTSKQNAGMHGIGLSSIQKAARRYGGSVTPRIDNEKHWFSLMVMIPGKESKPE